MGNIQSSDVRPTARVLTDAQTDLLHDAAMKILETTGILVHHEGAVDMLRSAGCRDAGGNRICIPRALVAEAAASAPSQVDIFDRGGEPAMMLTARNSYWGTGSDTPFVFDSRSNGRRATCLEDVRTATRLVDSLPNFDFLMCMAVAHELPQTIADKHHFATMVAHTSKPLVFTAASEANLTDIRRMASLVAGGDEALRTKPFILHYAEPIAPLIHPRDSLEKLLFCVRHGIPVIYTSATTAGQNGPATLAGSLAMSVARVMSGVVIGQLACRGAPMIVTMHASSMEPRNGAHTYASPEHVICQAAARDMADRYGLPTFGRAGTSDSKLPDRQAAFEAGYEILAQALCGENLIHDVGYIESGLTASWDMMVMCNEFIGAAKRVARGFTIDSDSLALDLIDAVGPDGHFMAEPHTAEHYRDEFWIPELLDRDNVQTWTQNGGMSLLARARERIEQILDAPVSKPFDGDILKEITEIANTDHSA